MIGDKTFEKGGELITALMKSYRTKINEAYLVADEELKIGFSLSIKPAPGKGTFLLEAGINFITEKIKDQWTATVDELQLDLFEDQAGGPQEEQTGGDRKLLTAPLGLLPAPGEVVEADFEEGPPTPTEEPSMEPEPEDHRTKVNETPSASCTGCEHHRGMINKHKGVKIPGTHGKCIREGGWCFAVAEAIKAQDKGELAA